MSSKERSLFIVFSESNVEILRELEKAKTPLQFKDLRALTNPKTHKKFSSSTIAAKLKFLEEQGMIQDEVIATSKRKLVGYNITSTGKETLKIFRETEEKLEKALN